MYFSKIISKVSKKSLFSTENIEVFRENKTKHNLGLLFFDYSIHGYLKNEYILIP